MNKLSPEKITQIKEIIHQKYNEMDINSQIKDLMTETFSKSSVNNLNNHETSMKNNQVKIIEELNKKGIIDSLFERINMNHKTEYSKDDNIAFKLKNDQYKFKNIGNLKLKIVGSSLEFFFFKSFFIKHCINNLLYITFKVKLDASKFFLHFQIINGKAFLDYLESNDNKQQAASFKFYINFLGQRYKTKSIPCSCEPLINEDFLLELGKKENLGIKDSSSLISVCEKIHLVMTRTNINEENQLISSNYIEWRNILTLKNNKQLISIELMGIGEEAKIPVGILNVFIQLFPCLDEPLKEDVLSAQLGLEYTKNMEKERLFLIYTKQWWREFLELRNDHKNRYVKIFAQDENSINRFVCSYIRPLRPGRLLDSPRLASRFVSLIGYKKRDSSFCLNEYSEEWLNLHTFLVKNCGNSENHSILLCSLLLGYGLDAYVCLGTKSKNQPHSWVVTISYDFKEVIFWESLTGNRYIHSINNQDNLNVVITHPYKTIGCIFNHISFYANIQLLANVDTCSFDLRDSSKWKGISEDAIKTICIPIQYFPLLCENEINHAIVSEYMEREIKSLVCIHRKEIGLSTFWDDNLSYVLSSALFSYENERINGLSIGNEEFDQAIKTLVPDGHSFKAFPIQTNSLNPTKNFNLCLKSPMFEQIIFCKGDQVKLALRIRIFPYPESCIATWIMLACRYKAI